MGGEKAEQWGVGEGAGGNAGPRQGRDRRAGRRAAGGWQHEHDSTARGCLDEPRPVLNDGPALAVGAQAKLKQLGEPTTAIVSQGNTRTSCNGFFFVGAVVRGQPVSCTAGAGGPFGSCSSSSLLRPSSRCCMITQAVGLDCVDDLPPPMCRRWRRRRWLQRVTHRGGWSDRRWHLGRRSPSRPRRQAMRPRQPPVQCRVGRFHLRDYDGHPSSTRALRGPNTTQHKLSAPVIHGHPRTCRRPHGTHCH